jgi:hypothetical protein
LEMENPLIVRRLPPYGDFCDTIVTSEKQTWNTRKKVISFALFTDTPGVPLNTWLLAGVLFNIKSAKLYFPDWVVRVYCTDCSASDEALILGFDNLELVRCRNDTILDTSKFHKAMKRFLAYDDPMVWYSNYRDVDSRFSPRELMAVNEWIGSGMGFHAMRDHPHHSASIMAGMFGMKRGVLQNTTMTALVNEAVSKNPTLLYGNPANGGEDQQFLDCYVWPLVKNSTMSHDEDQNRCLNSGARRCFDFPLGQRSTAANFFVGAPFKPGWLDENIGGYSCSIECKPSVSLANSTSTS